MSLAIAFIGAKSAVMAGDMREITFQGDKVSRKKLEKELYSGIIATNEELEKRAVELGVKIKIRDDKSKVTQRYGVLVGEVSSIEEGVVRKRRVYASAGSYVIAEIKGSEVKVAGKGSSSAFVVLGNNITKEIANKCIKENWKNGNFQDAIKIIMLVMERVAIATPSVSKNYILIQTPSKVDLFETVEQDMKQST